MNGFPESETMFAFLFWSCLLGLALWWVATSLTDDDDPVGQLLRAVPKVFTQPHLLGALPDPASTGGDPLAGDASRATSPPPAANPGASPGSSPGKAERVPVEETADASPAPVATRRPLFDAPGERDDLKRISGIGPVMERHLNELGIVSFAQLASFDDGDVARVDAALTDFHGRIVRDDWVGQARAFVSGEKR